MDFLTHSLVGAGAARLIASKPRYLPALSLAAVAGALLIDADPWLYLIDPSYYGRYHRVVSHSIIGMIGITTISIVLAYALYRWIRRIPVPNRSLLGHLPRFGWFVSPNLPEGEAAVLPPLLALVLAAMAGVGLHWCYDVITGFGNMEPFWPWSDYDASLHAVSSFDAMIFTSTLGWHLLTRQLNWPRKREVVITAVYLIAMIIYVAARYHSGERSII